MRERRQDIGVGALLFESEPDEERLRIEVRMLADGGMVIHQESEGDLTLWCFEESPHRVDTVLGHEAVRGLAEYFHVDTPEQLVEVLVMEFCGYDAAVRVRRLLKRLELAYEVHEHPVVR